MQASSPQPQGMDWLERNLNILADNHGTIATNETLRYLEKVLDPLRVRNQLREALELDGNESPEFERKSEMGYLQEKYLLHNIEFQNEDVAEPSEGLVTDVGRNKKGHYLVVVYNDKKTGLHSTHVYPAQVMRDRGHIQGGNKKKSVSGGPGDQTKHLQRDERLAA